MVGSQYAEPQLSNMSVAAAGGPRNAPSDCRTGNFLRNPARVRNVFLSMKLNDRRWKALACISLTAVTMASSVWSPFAVAQATARSPVRLVGNAVGGVRFGTSQATAIDELAAMFGSLRTTKLKAIGWCGLTAQSTGTDVLFNFERARFVGYEIGNASGKTLGQPNVVTAAGLGLGDTIAHAEKVYGKQFITSAAQGGSWKVKTPTGEMVGLLVNPPMTGSSDQIDMIGAGDFGCAAMGP